MIPSIISDCVPRPRSLMDITQAYGIAAGGILLIFVLKNLRSHIEPLIDGVSLLISKHLIYRYVLHRHRLLGPWSRAHFVIHLIYITANIFCVSFRASNVTKAGIRAGVLSLINLISLFAGLHLGFLADLLGISVSTYRHAHRSAGLMSAVLLIFHITSVLSSSIPFTLNLPEHLFGLIVSIQAHTSLSKD